MCENPKLQQLMENAACEMEKLGYSKSIMQYYHEVWNRYLKYTALCVRIVVVGQIKKYPKDTRMEEERWPTHEE